MRWAAREGLPNLALPPGQLGLGHAGVGDFIDHVVNFAAEGVKGGDGGAPLLGQEQEGVIETAAGGGGFLLDIVLGRHAGDCRRQKWLDSGLISLRSAAHGIDREREAGCLGVKMKNRPKTAQLPNTESF